MPRVTLIDVSKFRRKNTKRFKAHRLYREKLTLQPHLSDEKKMKIIWLIPILSFYLQKFSINNLQL